METEYQENDRPYQFSEYRKLAEIKMKKLQNQNDKLLSPSPIEGMSFEKFSNFLKKGDNKLKYSHDIELVDKMIKMVFSNLWIDDRKIV